MLALRAKIEAWNKARLRKRRWGDYPHQLAVLGIMKNEAFNIDEWVSHYVSVGADKIFLIDNGSTDNSVEKAKVWVEKGIVELIELPKPYSQERHYWTAVKHFKIKTRFRWLIIADLDEFWFCPDNTKISDKLGVDQFEIFQVIYANWRVFGSSGLVQHPSSIRESFVHYDPTLVDHIRTKYICKTMALKRPASIWNHKITGVDSSKVISDNFNFRLHHYQIQSREFFETTKMVRGDAVYKRPPVDRDWDYFNKCDAACTQEDRSLSDLVKNGTLGSGKTD